MLDMTWREQTQSPLSYILYRAIVRTPVRRHHIRVRLYCLESVCLLVLNNKHQTQGESITKPDSTNGPQHYIFLPNVVIPPLSLACFLIEVTCGSLRASVRGARTPRSSTPSSAPSPARTAQAKVQGSPQGSPQNFTQIPQFRLF